jgi:hypothetical protein
MKDLRKNLTNGVKFLALFLTLSLASCGESSTQSNDGQGAGSQADQGTSEAQGPHTGAGHSATGGADTLGNAKAGEVIDSSAIQRGLDTVNTIPGNGSNKNVPVKPSKQ